MKEEPDPYTIRGIDPKAPAIGLKKIRNKSNPDINQNRSFKKCLNCGKIVSPSEFHNSKYCNECAKNIKTCSKCGKEFMSSMNYYSICPSCYKIQPKICVKCGKEFIPKKSYYHTCPNCY